MRRNIFAVVEWVLLLGTLLPLTWAFSPAAYTQRRVAGRQMMPARSKTTTTTFRLASTTAATTSPTTSLLPEGITKQVRTKGISDKAIQLGDIITVQYEAYALDTTGTPTRTLIARNTPSGRPQQMVLGDSSMIAGWEYGLASMTVGESAILTIDNADDWGYGVRGVPPLIPPSALLEIHVTLLDAVPAAANIDFDAIAEADATPRTAKDIAAAYAVRQANKEVEEDLGWIQGFIKKAQSYYFFGLFEGETGERPPWFLRPSITFPLAFVICGGAFAVSLLSGAITERGAPVQDELDEIILSSTTMFLPMMMHILTQPL
jgi:FK506-binding protein 1